MPSEDADIHGHGAHRASSEHPGHMNAGEPLKAEHVAGGRAPADGRKLTRLAVSATLHCLTGCAIGEVLGMVLGTWWGWGNWSTVALAVVLAFGFGYALTIGPVSRANVPFGQAIKVALAADTASIFVMEIMDNAFILTVPGAMEAGLTQLLFWGSLVLSLAVAFAVTVPVNRWLIGRGRGHAVVHAHHHV